MKKNNRATGLKAENYFASRLNEVGIEHSFEDTWFDFRVNGHPVEVKSCQPSVVTISHGRSRKTVGRFDFTKALNRKKQRKHNIWVCFVLRRRSEFLLYGFIQARGLPDKRYVSVHEASELKLFSFEQWIRKINRGT